MPDEMSGRFAVVSAILLSSSLVGCVAWVVASVARAVVVRRAGHTVLT